MFAASYFAARYFAPRYFPPVVSDRRGGGIVYKVTREQKRKITPNDIRRFGSVDAFDTIDEALEWLRDHERLTPKKAKKARKAFAQAQQEIERTPVPIKVPEALGKNLLTKPTALGVQQAVREFEQLRNFYMMRILEEKERYQRKIKQQNEDTALMLLLEWI